METRYDLSFMKEYAELYNIKNEQLAQKFGCGISIVPKILSGELKVKEHAMEEIAYEFGYSDYDKFKEDILKKIEHKKKILFDKKIEEVKKEKQEKEYRYKKEIEEMNIYSTFDFNKMKNTDRIIISLLCDENLIYSIKQVAEIVKVDEIYVKELYNKILFNLEYIEHAKEKVKTKE